jgi:hypothetical protein
MEHHDIARYLHVGAGTVALVTFWLNAALRKGSGAHRLVGRTYMTAMLVVIVSTLPITARAFLDHKPITGLFLAYLVLITSVAVWSAWRAVRLRHSYAAFVGGPHRAVGWITFLTGVAVVGTGVAVGAPLLIGMGAIGVLVGPGMLRDARRAEPGPRWWLEAHYGGILGAGVATHIAFLNIGLQRLVPGEFSQAAHYAAWFGPVVAAILVGRWLDRRYGRRAGRIGSVQSAGPG